MNRSILTIPLVILALLLSGCAALTQSKTLRAEVHYTVKGDKVTIVSAETNYRQHRAVFLAGFSKGYSDHVNKIVTLVHFEPGHAEEEQIYLIGWRLGSQVAEENAQDQSSAEQPSESTIRAAYLNWRK